MKKTCKRQHRLHRPQDIQAKWDFGHPLGVSMWKVAFQNGGYHKVQKVFLILSLGILQASVNARQLHLSVNPRSRKREARARRCQTRNALQMATLPYSVSFLADFPSHPPLFICMNVSWIRASSLFSIFPLSRFYPPCASRASDDGFALAPRCV